MRGAAFKIEIALRYMKNKIRNGICAPVAESSNHHQKSPGIEETGSRVQLHGQEGSKRDDDAD
jgi:hypothetical protein